MPVVTAELTTRRDPAELAPTVSDFYAVHTWCTWVTDTAKHDSRPDTRVVTMATGTRVVEELVESGPTFVRYRMDDDPANPMKDYEAEVRVAPAADGGAVLTWSTSFTCDPAMEGPLSENIRATCGRGLEDLAKA